jgi:hypothetical protein
MSDWTQRSTYRCPACGHFLNISLGKGQGWVARGCERCGAPAPSREVFEGVPPESDEITTETLEDGSVAVVGVNGGWWVSFSDGGPAGACYSGGVLLDFDSRPPFPEGFHGFISWAGEDDVIIVDQDPINRTHSVNVFDAQLSEEFLELADPSSDPAGCRLLAELLYRSAYSL